MDAFEPAIECLVCADCRAGLFAHEGFQAAWTSQKMFDGYAYSALRQSIEEAADVGCNWCGLVRQAVRRHSGARNATVIDVKVTFRASVKAMEKPRGLWLIINNRPMSRFSIHTTSDNVAAGFIDYRTLIRDVASTRSFELAKQCLRHCALHHERCLKPERSKLPTRLIDCLDPSNPKIYVGNGMVKDYYATLSYVWGEKQLGSTTSNIHDHVVNGLDTQVLPQTIKDAITTTNSLGLRYLWVDAFCILQDSAADKDRELTQMGPIYERAYVTIIASNASKVSQGFLAERPEPITDVRLPFRCPDGQIGIMTLSRGGEYFDPNEPINKRAWCLQELNLSARALIYASPTLQYHCQTHTVNIGSSIRLERHAIMPILPTPPASPDEIRYAWNKVLCAYGHRSMTEPGDKLVAIAGIAERFHRMLGRTRYLAGLWEHNILSDLLWSTRSRQPRPAKYRAPSWSWAAVDGTSGIPLSLLYCGSNELPECEILEVDVTPASEMMPFGAVRSGILKLNGVLVTDVNWDPDSNPPSLFIGEVRVARVDPDSTDETSAPVCVVPLRVNRKEKYAIGLVLRPVDGQDGVFKRVGCFESGNLYQSFRDLQEVPFQTGGSMLVPHLPPSEERAAAPSFGNETMQDLTWLDGVPRTVVLI
ncbi:HET-domain-containing protein [Geopyxis carbonaria]|nr:HET-domain-containing protein [Geopyxis carbonaria]